MASSCPVIVAGFIGGAVVIGVVVVAFAAVNGGTGGTCCALALVMSLSSSPSPSPSPCPSAPARVIDSSSSASRCFCAYGNRSIATGARAPALPPPAISPIALS